MAKKTAKKPAKKAAKTAKKAAKKPAAPRRTRPQPAVPPPDNPLLRFEELQADRIVLPTAETAGTRRATRGAAAAAAETEQSEVKTAARLRLEALEASRGMPGEPELATPAAAVRGLAEEPGGPQGVAPVAGISNWVQLGPITIPKGQTYSAARVRVTGRVTSIVVDPTNPQTIYLGAAQGGVWKSTDGGKSWRPKSDNEVSLAIGALAMVPGSPLTLYAGTGEGNFSGDSYYGNGVLKTTDGGNTWTTLATATFVGSRFSRIAVTPGTPARLFAANGNGLYRSTDSGVTWTKLAGGLPNNAAATDVAIDPATPTTVYAAFWGQGIYKTVNAGAAAPAWTKLAGGLPAASFTRIALGLSPSSPLTVYALIANNAYTIDAFFRTTDGGTTWTAIPLPGGNIGGQGFYNINVAVDPTTPDIVFLSGISVWKATRSGLGVWTITNVGLGIHPDNHAFAFDPTNHLVVYAGSDGGIYKSSDGGVTWTDTINKGPCITQYEFISQHPASDAVVFGGTQDNGTEQFRNHPVFNHADDGDGGFCIVDVNQPKNVLSTYYNPSPKRSTQGGKFGTWLNVSAGILGSGLFYPPLTADLTNPNNVAIGTDRINLDAAQGTGGWPTKVSLPGLIGKVSAINYVNGLLIYAATSAGQVYRLVGPAWTATLISAPPLPSAYVWDINAVPGNPNEVILVMSGFGIQHVWRGVVPGGGGGATWTSISSNLPDIPVNALVIEPAAPTTLYIATDVAVYRTTNGGASWTQFSEGLPNSAVFDLQLHGPSRLLRAGTHGRGLWERRLDVAAMPNADVFVRDNLMDSGRSSPSPSGVAAAFEDPLQYVNLGDTLFWWMCADIKVDALEGTVPSYQMPVANVDTVAFETVLQHRNAQRGKINRIYVQVHNRGIQTAANVTVKLLAADASAGLPNLPADFWTVFPNNSANITQWVPIGAAKVIPSLSNTEPAILEWDWSTPLTQADHSCLLVVIDSVSDPIPPASKVFEIWKLVPNERRAGLKNLHVVDAPLATIYGTTLALNGGTSSLQALRFIAEPNADVRLGLLLPASRTTTAASRARKTAAAAPAGREPQLRGFTVARPSAAVVKALRARRPQDLETWDLTRLYNLDPRAGGGRVGNLRIPRGGVKALLVVSVGSTGGAEPFKFTVIQEDGNQIIGGSTFVVRKPPRA